MKILIIHNEFPGQFGPLIQALGGCSQHELVGIHPTNRHYDISPEIPTYSYPTERGGEEGPLDRRVLEAFRNGRAVARALLSLKARGFSPDVVLGHLGWGETLYIKEVFPDVPLIGYCEFFHGVRGKDADFDPEIFVPDFDDVLRIRTMNAVEALGLTGMDVGISPTLWQKGTFPEIFHRKIRICHEGVDLRKFAPQSDPSFRLPSGRILGRKDEVVTFATHHLEPHRGIHAFLRALNRVLEARPSAQILMAGKDQVSYGRGAPEGTTWREHFMREAAVTSDRVHYLGHLDESQYRALLGVSRVHVYLTVPFVLSWSLIEAMAMGCTIVGSDTAPVREVIERGINGDLVDFHNPGMLADKVIDILADPQKYRHFGSNARKTAEARFDRDKSIHQYLSLFNEIIKTSRHQDY